MPIHAHQAINLLNRMPLAPPRVRRAVPSPSVCEGGRPESRLVLRVAFSSRTATRMPVSVTGIPNTASASADTLASPRGAATRAFASPDPPPRRRAFRLGPRPLFRLSGTWVSPASAMPVSPGGSRYLVPGNRCRQRNAVETAGPRRSADARTLSPSGRQSQSGPPFLPVKAL